MAEFQFKLNLMELNVDYTSERNLQVDMQQRNKYQQVLGCTQVCRATTITHTQTQDGPVVYAIYN